MQQKKKSYYLFFSDDFAQVKEPHHPETILAKKRYTSIVERVFMCFSS